MLREICSEVDYYKRAQNKPENPKDYFESYSETNYQKELKGNSITKKLKPCLVNTSIAAVSIVLQPKLVKGNPLPSQIGINT
jgi:hypothetical protein